MYYLNADQEVSTGLRSQSSSVRSAQVLSDLYSVDPGWSAFNYYRSKLHSHPNQLCYSILDNVIVSSNSPVRARPAPSKLCVSCKLVNAQHRRMGPQPNSKSLLNQNLLHFPLAYLQILPPVRSTGHGL